MSGNGSYIKSMNGIVSLDTGGTIIEGGDISSDVVNCNTINATLDITSSNAYCGSVYTDFIINNGNTDTVFIPPVVFNDTVKASFVPTTNDSLCNKLYVDNITAGSILTLPNTFTGTSNTFNNVINTSKIDSITPSNTYNLLSSHTGQLNIGPTGATGNINIGSATVPVRSSYTPIAANDLCNKTYVDSVVPITTNLLPATNIWTGVSNTFNNVVNIGPTGATGPSQLKLLSNGISTTYGTDTIDFGIGITTGTVNIGRQLGNGGGSVVLNDNFKFYNDVPNDTLHFRTINQFDEVEICSNLTGGSLSIGSGLTNGSCNIASSLTSGVLNLASGIISGEINIGEGISTGIINIATFITTGSVNMCGSFIFTVNSIASSLVSSTINLFTNITTGRLNIGTSITTGDIFIGNTSGTTAGALGDITMGNGANNNNTANNGRVTINKLRIGTSPILRNIRYGSVAGTASSGSVNFSPAFPSGQVPFMVGTIQSSSNNRAYSLAFSSVTNTSFTYNKYYIASTGGFNAAVTEGFHYYAWSD
jgi:hypothetical protein